MIYTFCSQKRGGHLLISPILGKHNSNKHDNKCEKAGDVDIIEEGEKPHFFR